MGRSKPTMQAMPVKNGRFSRTARIAQAGRNALAKVDHEVDCDFHVAGFNPGKVKIR